MRLDAQSNFLKEINRMFDNNPIFKNENGIIDESHREKYVSRAITLKEAGLDITENAKITASFFREFSNVTTSSSNPTHEEKVEALSKRYVEMRDELGEMFKDNEDEYNNQIEKLNLAFKGALDSTTMMMYPSNPGKLQVFEVDQEAERTRYQEKVARRTNALDVMKNFRDNLSRHVNIFYESFINYMQTNDYDTAFQESMSLLKGEETSSYDEISYTDMVHIMDVMNNKAIEFDKNGIPTKMRYNSTEDAFIELINDERISYSVRKSIADIFNYYIKNEEKQEEMEDVENYTE